MKKEVAHSIKGSKGEVGLASIVRSLPNKYAHSIGPFVFLGQIPKKTYSTKAYKKSLEETIGGETAHPHRGIGTFTYAMIGS